MRSFGVVLGILSVTFFCKCGAEKEKAVDRPNILYIMTDDHAFQTISAYSDELIKTPNIDRIADQGVLFRNSFVGNSICAPSRVTLLTGKHTPRTDK